jgi:predicted permease
MNLRQKLQSILLLFLILLTFASYHQGSTAWLQWLTVVTLLFFAFVFDLLFTSDAHFIFDPDAENWRRKTVRVIPVARRCCAETARSVFGHSFFLI